MFHIGCAIAMLQKLMMATSSRVKMDKGSMSSCLRLICIEADVIIGSCSELILISSARTCILHERSFEVTIRRVFVRLLGVQRRSRRVVFREEH